MWNRVSPKKHASYKKWVQIVQPGEYAWILHVRRWCALLSNCFNRLFISAYRYCKVPFTRYNLLSSRFSKWFHDRLNVCMHDTAGCQTGCQSVWPVVSCTQTFNRLSNRYDNRFDNRLYRVKPVVKPVVQPCWTNIHCSFNRLSNRVVQPVW